MEKIVLPKMIDYYRKQNNWTMKQLGEKINKSESAVSRWIKGERSPMIDDLEKLSLLFDTNVETLMFGANAESSTDVDCYPFFDSGVAAGYAETIDPILNGHEDSIEMTDISMGRYAGDKDVFFTRVCGHSMDEVIPDKSLIALKSYSNIQEVEDGDIVMFQNDNSFSLKRFFKDEERKELIFRPESTVPTFRDIIFSYEDASEVNFLGKVVLYIVSL